MSVDENHRSRGPRFRIVFTAFALGVLGGTQAPFALGADHSRPAGSASSVSKEVADQKVEKLLYLPFTHPATARD